MSLPTFEEMARRLDHLERTNQELRRTCRRWGRVGRGVLGRPMRRTPAAVVRGRISRGRGRREPRAAAVANRATMASDSPGPRGHRLGRCR